MDAKLVFTNPDKEAITWKATIEKSQYSDMYYVNLITDKSTFKFKTYTFCGAARSINRKLKLLGFTDKIEHSWRM